MSDIVTSFIACAIIFVVFVAVVTMIVRIIEFVFDIINWRG